MALQRTFSPHLFSNLKFYARALGLVVMFSNLEGEDLDGDGLEDRWELSHFADLSQGAAGDPDGDGYSNLEEAEYGLDPNVAAGASGFLLQESWYGVAGVKVDDLRSHEKFYGAPDLRKLTLGVENEASGDHYGSRYRGTLTAPITGAYTFWIAGDDGVELWLSSDSSKFNRQRIAWHAGSTGVNDWERFSTQQSAPIYLSAGQKYYVEVLHKEASGGDHVSMAWSYEANDLVNVALDAGAVATQSSTRDAGGAASRAIDGNREGDFSYNSVTHTNSEPNSWWQVDLGEERHIEKIVLYNRTGSARTRLSNFKVSVLDRQGGELYARDYHTTEGYVNGHLSIELESCVCGRIVKVQLLGNNLRGDGILSLAEVEVLESLSGAPNATALGYLTNWTQEAGVTSSQSTTLHDGAASRAIDGNRNGNYSLGSVTHTDNVLGSWWEVNLGQERPVNRIAVYNRTGSAQTRLSNYRVVLLNALGQEIATESFYETDGHAPYFSKWDLPGNLLAQKVRVESLGLNRRGDHIISLAEVEVLGNQNLPIGDMQAREVIPSSVFESFVLDPHDPDDDYMPCDWEMLFGFDSKSALDPVSGGAFGDPDGDHIANWQECRFGTDPLVPNRVTGALSESVWTGVAGTQIADLYAHPSYLGEANFRRLIDQSEATRWLGSQTGARVQGFITAPETGSYTFWLSGDDQVEFWLSTDSSKFNKQLILAPTAAYGFQEYEVDLSDQMATVSLVAGETYYLELLYKEGSGGGASPVSLAWQPPSEDRSLIPARYLSSYGGHTNDLDNDDLPDDWEISFGLDASDNGSTNPVNGAFGDYDGDGLSNIEEFRAGSSPIIAGLTPGHLTLDRWNGIPSEEIESLTQSVNFPVLPDSSEEVTLLKAPSGSNIGARFRGFLEAPVTGSYQFWITADDRAELWLSENSSAFGRKRIAEVQEYKPENNFGGQELLKSVQIPLVAGTRYYFEVLHKQARRATHVSLEWSIDGAAQVPIPFTHFYSFSIDSEDLDDDLLRDSWEVVHGFSTSAGVPVPPQELAYADPDQDFIPNYLESYLDTDPWVAQPYAGALSRELWRGIEQDSLSVALENEDSLYQDAAVRDLQFSSTTGGSMFQKTFRRIRGYLVAPEAGNYRFWISARGGAELWLSPGLDKYHKKRIAHISTESGHGAGVGYDNPLRWDTFVDQMSEEVYLDAGQLYFIEALGQMNEGRPAHISLAWARPGLEREPIPSSAFLSYALTPDDRDDDCLPDAWELAHGLSATDNGLVDRDLQGERGDFDLDGVTNRIEYLLGLDPSSSDTDGDGISDYDELYTYYTDPTVSDLVSESIVDTIDLESVENFEDDWITTGSGGLLATSFRGTGAWNFNVPSHGHWVVQMSAQLRGDLRFEESLAVLVAINGTTVARQHIKFHGEVPGTLRILTPWLPAGQHRFSIFIDNNTIRRSLEVSSIQVMTPCGEDLNKSGLADWAETELAKRSSLHTQEQISHISPAFIEGDSPALSLVDITSVNRSRRTNRVRRYKSYQMRNMLTSYECYLRYFALWTQWSMRCVQISPHRNHYNGGRFWGRYQAAEVGPGTMRWATSIDLIPNDIVGFVAQFENFGTYETGKIAWMPVNVLSPSSRVMTIPVGSKLLMGAWVSDQDNKNVTITVAGETYRFKARKTKIHQFNTPGTYVLNATHQHGRSGTLTVEVKDATLPDHLSAGEQRFFDVDLPHVASDLGFDTNDEVWHNGLSHLSSGSTVKLGGLEPGLYRSAARLTSSHAGGRGAILDQTETYVVGVSDALRNGSDTISPLDDDYFVVRSPLLVTHLPPGGTVVITLISGGVTFADSTTEPKTITQADLDENGVYLSEFHIPKERLGAPCHYIEVFNAQGQMIWSERN